jgi:hypothetical protein
MRPIFQLLYLATHCLEDTPGLQQGLAAAPVRLKDVHTVPEDPDVHLEEDSYPLGSRYL